MLNGDSVRYWMLIEIMCHYGNLFENHQHAIDFPVYDYAIK